MHFFVKHRIRIRLVTRSQESFNNFQESLLGNTDHFQIHPVQAYCAYFFNFLIKIKIFQTNPSFSLYYITEALQNQQKGRDRSYLTMLESETTISMRYICGISGGCIGSAIYGSETVRMPKMRHRIYSYDGASHGTLCIGRAGQRRSEG